MKTTCPACAGIGRVMTEVLARHARYGRLVLAQELRFCPVCHSIGRLAATPPETVPLKVVPGDVGILQGSAVRHVWRRCAERTGEITGLPRFRGVAVATDGVLLAIKRSDNSIVIGHLESFVVDPSPSARSSTVSSTSTTQRRGALAALAAEFA